MSGPGHKSILITTSEGNQMPLHRLDPEREREQSPRAVDLPAASATGSGGVQFDSEQLERGRSRTKSAKESGGLDSSKLLKSASRSRSRSSASRRIRDEEFLKWTVLRRDPSMRLKLVPKGGKKKPDTNGSDEEDDCDNDDEDEDDEDEDEEDEDEDEDYSDEEQVLDVENDFDIDKEFHYDLGMKVLPNFVVSLNDILDSSKKWIKNYELSVPKKGTDEITTETLSGDYMKSMQILTKGKGSANGRDRSYILCTDMSTESQYALTYVMGSVVANGDTLYIVNWDNSSYGDTKTKLESNVAKCKLDVLHMFDCVSAVIDDLDVVILSVNHPYPKHLLNEMIFGLKPIALCCSLSMVLSTLQNFVCSIPTLVIRKKLKRTKKKGISE